MDRLLLTIALLCVVPLMGWLPSFWQRRRLMGILIVVMRTATATSFLTVHFGLWSCLFGFITVYQLINDARLVKNQMQADFLRRSSYLAVLVLTVVQLLVLVAAARFQYDHPSYATIGTGLAIWQLFIGLLLLSSTLRHLRTTKTLQVAATYADRDLPSISVLIPARNETDDLDRCLHDLLQSDYPKLEVIVLDDCSQDRRTPEIIRSFAHDGVRFIAGSEPAPNWLAKNYAYEKLAEAASGDYLVFCGVDSRFHATALRELITTMLEKQKTVLSVLPKNAVPGARMSYLIQPCRYAWELCLPRRLTNRPAVLSTCWIIKRTSWQSAGTFKATSRSIAPESYFARAAAHTDSYSFVRSDLVCSDKSVSEQLATATRTRYPQLHRRPELVPIVAFIEATGVLLPLPLALVLLLNDVWLGGLLAALAWLLTVVVYVQVTVVMYGRLILLSPLLAPLAVAYDFFMVHYSMYRYEFDTVIWKDRNVCLPVMRLDPVLPKLAGRPNRG